MGQTLTEIAQQLKNANKKVQLIYAFNGNLEMSMATVALLIPAIGLSRLIAMT